MSVIVKLPSGSWRAQVRRKGKYISDTFRRQRDAEEWALEAERDIDRGLVPRVVPRNAVRTFADIIALPAQIRVAGPEAILAGSCSDTTRGQVDLHKRDHPAFAIDVDSVMTRATKAEGIVAFVIANRGKLPLVYSSGTPDEVKFLQDRYGREQVAHTLDRLFAEIASRLIAEGIRRLVVAGGETSGAVVSALDLGALTIGPEIDPGVPVLVSGGSTPVALALKSGNFGSPEFFSKALETMYRE